MAERSGTARVRWIAVVVIAALLVVVGPLVLHFGQKRHDRLAWDVAAQFPSNKPIVGGEVFATTVIAIM